MKYELPPLPALHAFEAAARHENFAVAAQELNLSQSTVSHRVRLLERYLGYPLFERLPRGLRLTESGKAYLPSVRKAFDEIFASTSGIFGFKGKGTLTVRAPVSYSALWLAPMLESFLAAYPGIEVRLTSSVWADDLATDETDIDLRLGYGHWSGYKTELLLRESVLPVCSPLVLQDSSPIKSIEDFSKRALIHVMGLEDLWMKFFAMAGLRLTTRRHDIRVDSAMAALEMAASGTHFALLQKRFLDPYLRTKRLIIPLQRKMQIEQALYLLQPESIDRPKPEATLFCDWLLDKRCGDR